MGRKIVWCVQTTMIFFGVWLCGAHGWGTAVVAWLAGGFTVFCMEEYAENLIITERREHHYAEEENKSLKARLESAGVVSEAERSDLELRIKYVEFMYSAYAKGGPPLE